MQVFSIFEALGISVDVVATSEVSISLTLDPSKLWSRELIQQVSLFVLLPLTLLLLIYFHFLLMSYDIKKWCHLIDGVFPAYWDKTWTWLLLLLISIVDGHLR